MPGKLACSVGIKRSVVADFLSVALVVLARAVGCNGVVANSMRRVDCCREGFRARRTGHWVASGAGLAPVNDEESGEAGLGTGCGRSLLYCHSHLVAVA